MNKELIRSAKECCEAGRKSLKEVESKILKSEICCEGRGWELHALRAEICSDMIRNASEQASGLL